MREAQGRPGSAARTIHFLSISALLVLCDPVSAQRWTEPLSQAEEVSATQTLIRAIRAENWLEAVGTADRFRGSPTSAFSQYQAFAYAMTGRLDLVAELQREGRIPSAVVCEDTGGLEFRDAVETIVEAATRHRAVILQEMHWEPQHRSLLHALLRRLREQGFTYFAAEDFEGTPEAYLTASYPGGVRRGLLFETAPADPLMLAGVALALVGGGVLGCLGPALRATAINPIVALRAD